jgi:hypothetical protein
MSAPGWYQFAAAALIFGLGHLALNIWPHR